MKIVIFGGSGLIGSRLVKRLRATGHEVIAASPRAGVNAITGEGLSDAMAGATVVVDVMNSPSWEDAAVLKLFATSTQNLLAAGLPIISHYLWLAPSGCRRAGFSVRNWRRNNLSPILVGRTRSCGRLSFSSSSVRSPKRRPTARPCGCRLH